MVKLVLISFVCEVHNICVMFQGGHIYDEDKNHDRLFSNKELSCGKQQPR